MKKFALTAALLVGTLGLAGCNGSPGASLEEVKPVPTIAPSKPAPVKAVKVKSVEEVKESALEAGRPEAAWDIGCVAWKMPGANAEADAWANELGADFLKSKSAKCPDAITFPFYFIESFAPGAEGELIVGIEQDMNRILHGPERGEYQDLYDVAWGVMRELKAGNPSLKKVTAQLPNGDRYGTTIRGEERRASNVDGLL